MENQFLKTANEDGELRFTYSVEEINIQLPKDVDPSKISIRTFSDISNPDKVNLDTNIFMTYPNPSNGVFQLENKTLTPIDAITVYDEMSRIVMNLTELVTVENQLIDLTSLPEGVYYLHIKSQGILNKRRIIIEK